MAAKIGLVKYTVLRWKNNWRYPAMNWLLSIILKLEGRIKYMTDVDRPPQTILHHPWIIDGLKCVPGFAPGSDGRHLRVVQEFLH